MHEKFAKIIDGMVYIIYAKMYVANFLYFLCICGARSRLHSPVFEAPLMRLAFNFSGTLSSPFILNFVGNHK